MAFGRHWEWRGFGELDGTLRQRLDRLPLVFDTPQEITDRYLWVPRCELNVKLREGALKLKRLLERAPGGIEEWLEDERENYEFPVPREALSELETALGVVPGDLGAAPAATEEELLERLERTLPEIRVVAVGKSRWLRSDPEAGGAFVEVAQILQPERVFSVAVEAPGGEAVREVVTRFGLREALREASYLDALAVWARGGTVGG